MPRNENKYDELFRNQLRDLSHPVRSELWSRIQSGIRVRKASVPRKASGPRQPLGKLWLLPASSLTVAAALAITLGIIRFTHTAKPPSAQPVNHYSTITPAIAPARSTGESSVTPQDSSRDRSSESATPKNIPATRIPDAPGTTFTKPNPTPENPATAIIRPAIIRRNHLKDRITSADRGAHAMSAEERSIHRHKGRPVTLPALARTCTRAAITAGSPDSKSRHNSSNSPVKTPRFQRAGYVSLYASPDFPNHYYTWSYTLGARVTLQFSRRWSFTAGLEYARVNVPTQVVPPIGYDDTLHAFHFSNYEVPVLFGYTKSFRRSTLTVNAGAIINLYFHRSTGVWVFNWPDRDSYGAALGVEYSYSLGRSLAIFAQPYARYSISNYRMFIPAQRLSFGTLLGIKYQL